ncbi:MAG TPA: ABC transporter ATP-binding protein [Bordetella sp.]
MMLDIQNLCKAFGGFEVLSGIDLSLPDGGLLGLIGPNGAGKSTLFALISGLLPADAGRIRLFGADIDHAAPDARARAGMVRTFQVPREFRHLTVRQNLLAAAPGQAGERLVNVFLQPRRVARQEAELAARADDTLSFLNLARVADAAAGSLSGGQKKLLELGRALMTEPRLILLDEPFAGVNPVLIEEIMERIQVLNQRGIGFIIIEHDLRALSKLTPRLAVLDRGRIIAQGLPAEVLAMPVVRDAYFGGSA